MTPIHRLYAVLSARFRARRLQWFIDVISPSPKSTILDVGGYPWFWESAPHPYPITALNPHVIPGLAEKAPANFKLVAGDGCKLEYPDQSFDIVFSNSVIEHVGTYANQKAFAAHARRVGRYLWIQTPAREFFIEPHLLTPFIHFFPRSVQARLLRYGTVWGWLTKPTPAEVIGFLDEVRLLTYAEMKELFPDCVILRERFLGFTKSYVAIRPPQAAPPAPGRA